MNRRNAISARSNSRRARMARINQKLAPLGRRVYWVSDRTNAKDRQWRRELGEFYIANSTKVPRDLECFVDLLDLEQELGIVHYDESVLQIAQDMVEGGYAKDLTDAVEQIEAEQERVVTP